MYRTTISLIFNFPLQEASRYYHYYIELSIWWGLKCPFFIFSNPQESCLISGWGSWIPRFLIAPHLLFSKESPLKCDSISAFDHDMISFQSWNNINYPNVVGMILPFNSNSGTLMSGADLCKLEKEKRPSTLFCNLPTGNYKFFGANTLAFCYPQFYGIFTTFSEYSNAWKREIISLKSLPVSKILAR